MNQDANGRDSFFTRANRLFRGPVHPAAAQLPVEGSLPALDGATGWLNSSPLSAEGLRGRVVLVQFWTYTCINWLRTLAYIRAWAAKYSDHGLTVVGVHTPEFDFEHHPDNVRRAAKDLHVDYPIAIDSDYAIWSAFDNHYWPALYFVDAQGQIRHHRFGEGDSEQSEMVIQRLLMEAGIEGIGQDLVAVDAAGVEAAADWDSLWSPENYLSYERTQNFASPYGAVLDTPNLYATPPSLRLNHWALSGDWTVKRQAVVGNRAEGRIAYRFHARDLHLVMAPATPGTAIAFRVRIDGQPPGTAHGADVDDQGNGRVTEPRLYQLIRQPGPVTERTFEITFLDGGVQAYAFTFG
ncbi:MAG TPA: redoxin family protein [Actinomycetota bacterium]|nr:redoxin family protein [Actinomycetota bacterium]